MHSIGENGRRAHLLILISDLIMVILYTNFLFGINFRLASGITKSRQVIMFITFSPLLLAIVQISEIISNAILIINYESEYNKLVPGTFL